MSSDGFLFDENEWSFSPDIELMDEGVFLQKHEEMPINHTIYYNPYEIQEEIKSLNGCSFPFNESESLFKDVHPSRNVEVKEKLSETDTYNARGTLPNTDEDVSRLLMNLHTNEVENSQESQEGSLADTIKELIMLFKSRQDAIDDNTYKVKGRGRKRNKNMIKLKWNKYIRLICRDS